MFNDDDFIRGDDKKIVAPRDVCLDQLVQVQEDQNDEEHVDDHQAGPAIDESGQQDKQIREDEKKNRVPDEGHEEYDRVPCDGHDFVFTLGDELLSQCINIRL